MTSIGICAKYDLPYRFDGPMYASGLHIDSYNPSQQDPVHYVGMQDVVLEISNFSTLCLPLLKKWFPLECLVMQQALHSFDEVSPSYLGGNDGISLSINVSHNFANSSHYNSVDYRPSIVLWVMDDVASKNCDQYLVFNNIVQMVDEVATKHGVMIKISDGMLMSFQGDTLHHGTTICRQSSWKYIWHSFWFVNANTLCFLSNSY